MKGCLKHTHAIVTPPPTRSPSPPVDSGEQGSSSHTAHFACHDDGHDAYAAHLRRKSVSFCSQASNQVFFADEWDRSPAEVTPRLSYKDMLELKEIQLSLPRAPQATGDPDLPATDAHGAPRPHYLRAVPIALVPLLNPGNAFEQPHPPSRSPFTTPSNSSLESTSPQPFFLPASSHAASPHNSLNASISRRNISSTTTTSSSSTGATASSSSSSNSTTTTTTTTTSRPPSPPSTPPPARRLPYNFPPPPPPNSSSHPSPFAGGVASASAGHAWRGWAPPKATVGAVRTRPPPKFNFLPLLETPEAEPPEADRQATPTGELHSSLEHAVKGKEDCSGSHLPTPFSTPSLPPPLLTVLPPGESGSSSEASSEAPSPAPSFSYFNIPVRSLQRSALSTPQLLSTASTSPEVSTPSLIAPSPEFPLSSLAARMAHVRLSALPSPALPPPSPFSLYPPSPPPDSASSSPTLSVTTSTITNSSITTVGSDGSEEVVTSSRYTKKEEMFVLRHAGVVQRRSPSVSTGYGTEGEESEAESSVVHTETESDGEMFFAGAKAQRSPHREAKAGGGDAWQEEEEGEMTLVLLESGELGFVRVRR